MSHSTSVEVSRASQVHQIPHTGLAQIGPVINTAVQKMMPISAQDSARRSHLRFLVIRYPILPMKTTRKASMAVQAEGT